MAFRFPSSTDLIVGKICFRAGVSASESETEYTSMAGFALQQICTGTITNAKESLETPRREKGEREVIFCNTFLGARKVLCFFSYTGRPASAVLNQVAQRKI